MLKNIPMIIANGMLLLLSLVSSEILTFINININKNSIETAPTYTSKYDSPMKFNPNIIRYPAMLRNNPIKNSTDTIGFLLIMIAIPHNIDAKEIKFTIL